MTWTADRIAALRARLGLSQLAFAETLGFTRAASVSDIETGRREASGTVARLLDVLDAGGLAAVQPKGDDVPAQLDAAAATLQALAQRLREAGG